MPSKRKKSKSKHTKTKIAPAKRAKKAPRAKPARRPKKALKKSSKASLARKRKTLSGAQPFQSSWDREGTVSGRQTGDLQGLSRAEQADSESVKELVEEGNVPEAGAVAGVEEADNADEREVHTHEVPEDDVPEEYLDNE